MAVPLKPPNAGQEQAKDDAQERPFRDSQGEVGRRGFGNEGGEVNVPKKRGFIRSVLSAPKSVVGKSGSLSIGGVREIADRLRGRDKAEEELVPGSLSADEIEPIRRALSEIVGIRHVSVRPSARAIYARDCWPRSMLELEAGEQHHFPDVVVWPASTQQVAQIIRYARERKLAVIPHGAGSGMVAGLLPLRAGIALDLSRLNKITESNLPGRRVVVQAGVIGQRLEDHLNGIGATLGHFPSSIYCSSVGGWLATRSAGQFSAYYGKIEDMVLGLQVVTGAGEIIDTGTDRLPGPDLVQLLTGSEGILGVITSASLRIHPKPSARALRGARFKNVNEGLNAARELFRAGLRPYLLHLSDPLDSWLLSQRTKRAAGDETAGLELLRAALKENGLGYALAAPKLLNSTADLLPPRCLMVFSFEGESQARVEAQLRSAMDVIRDAGGVDLGERPARAWYRDRYSHPYKQSGIYSGGGWIDNMAVAATWDRVPQVHEAVRKAVSSEVLVLCRFSHAYLEGCSLQFSFIGSTRGPGGGRESYDRCWQQALFAALRAGATLSHHHGVGAHKTRYLPDELGVGGMRMLRSLKAVFDPDGIMNPGKLLL